MKDRRSAPVSCRSPWSAVLVVAFSLPGASGFVTAETRGVNAGCASGDAIAAAAGSAAAARKLARGAAARPACWCRSSPGHRSVCPVQLGHRPAPPPPRRPPRVPAPLGGCGRRVGDRVGRSPAVAGRALVPDSPRRTNCCSPPGGRPPATACSGPPWRGPYARPCSRHRTIVGPPDFLPAWSRAARRLRTRPPPRAAAVPRAASVRVPSETAIPLGTHAKAPRGRNDAGPIQARQPAPSRRAVLCRLPPSAGLGRCLPSAYGFPGPRTVRSPCPRSARPVRPRTGRHRATRRPRCALRRDCAVRRPPAAGPARPWRAGGGTVARRPLPGVSASQSARWPAAVLRSSRPPGASCRSDRLVRH